LSFYLIFFNKSLMECFPIVLLFVLNHHSMR
jgi:hypothetical protein